MVASCRRTISYFIFRPTTSDWSLILLTDVTTRVPITKIQYIYCIVYIYMDWKTYIVTARTSLYWNWWDPDKSFFITSAPDVSAGLSVRLSVCTSVCLHLCFHLSECHPAMSRGPSRQMSSKRWSQPREISAKRCVKLVFCLGFGKMTSETGEGSKN